MNTSLGCALAVAGTLFAFISLMHVLRIFYKVKVTVAGKTVPMWLSGVGVIFALIMSIWMFSVIP